MNMRYVAQRPYNLETIQHAVPKFWVIGVVSNPVRYGTRYNLFFNWMERLKRAPGVNVFVVEVQQGEREFVCTEKGNPTHLQMRTRDELWIKENMINRAINELTCGVAEQVAGVQAEYVAWVDTDVYFEHETTWHYETLHQLQTYDIVQMWETAVDLGPTGQIISPVPHQSFMSCYRKYGKEGYGNGSGTPLFSSYYGMAPQAPEPKRPYYHPGFAWAARLGTPDRPGPFSKVGMLLDRCVIGAGDHHLAMCLINMGVHSVPYDFRESSPYYLEMVEDYQRKCQREFQGRVGYVVGSLYHWWHGKKKLRKYWERWECIRPKLDSKGNVIEKAYDPYLDVFADAQGLLQLDGEKPLMRDALHDYFRNRNEDSIDVE